MCDFWSDQFCTLVQPICGFLYSICSFVQLGISFLSLPWAIVRETANFKRTCGGRGANGSAMGQQHWGGGSVFEFRTPIAHFVRLLIYLGLVRMSRRDRQNEAGISSSPKGVDFGCYCSRSIFSPDSTSSLCVFSSPFAALECNAAYPSLSRGSVQPMVSFRHACFTHQ